jgi:hypothetical protein
MIQEGKGSGLGLFISKGKDMFMCIFMCIYIYMYDTRG